MKNLQSISNLVNGYNFNGHHLYNDNLGPLNPSDLP